MSKHESTSTTVAIYRPWSKIDPKVIIGAVSSLTVGGIVSAAAAVGVAVPTWLAALFVIVAYAVAAYLTKTRIPVAPDSGLTEQQASGAAAAVDAGVALADGDVREAAAAAFRSLGYVVADDEDGTIVGGPDDGPALVVRPSEGSDPHTAS